MSASAAIGLLALTQTSQAQTAISWNYDYFGTFSGASQFAGVVSVANWNDSYLQGFPSAASETNLLDSSGATTSLGFTPSTTGNWRIQASDPGVDADGTHNKRLLNGYLDSGSQQTITLNAIPYNSYSIYVYLSSDTANSTGVVSVGSKQYDFTTLGTAAISGGNASLIQTTSTNGSNPSASYAVFTNLTGSSQTIVWRVINNGGIAGFQVVSNADVPVAIITQPPTSTVWRQNTANSLTVMASGAPVYYQWRTNTVDIPGATNATYSVAVAQFSDAGTYSVRVYNNVSSVISSNTVVTVSNDTNPPTLGGVNSYDGISVGVRFSKLLDPASSANAGNYGVSGGTVSSASLLGDGKTVALTMNSAISDQFIVTVNNVKDLAGNPIANNSKATNVVLNLQFADFSTFQSVSATYTGFLADIVAGGTDIWGTQDTFDYAYLMVTNDFDFSLNVQSLTDGGGGNFTRAGIMARDELDTGSGGAHETSMVWNYGNLFQHLYRATVGGTTTDNGTTTTGYGSNSWVRLARSGNIFRAYYSSNNVNWVQHLQLDGSRAGDGAFTNSVLYLGIAVCAHSASAVTTASVSDFGPTPHQAVSITAQPVASATWLQGSSQSLTVTATGIPVYYQWKTNGVSISGATNSTYSIPSVSLANGGTYTVLVYNDISSVLSSNSVITVSADTNAPFLNRVISYDGNSVWIQFNELLNATTATNTAYYTVPGSTVTNVVLGADGKSVTLYLSAPVSGYANVTITGIKDAFGNAVTNALGSAAIGDLQIVAFGDATNQTASATFDGDVIYGTGGGSDVWLDSDNFAYIYYPTQFTGAFDYRLRVQSVPDAYGGDSTRVFLMARDANNMTSDNVTASFVSTCVANGNNSGNGLIQVMYRRNGGIDNETNVQFYASGIPNPAFGTNNWIRLQRVDNSFNTYWSTNGTDWNFIVNVAKNGSSDYFPTNVYLGVAVCSHNAGATTTATVSDLGITSNPVPSLNIVSSGTNAMLNWPVDSLGYKVQVATNLAPAVWVNVTNAQSAVSGQFKVTAPANGSTKFYRLIQQ
jgi:hypothetical protein